MYYFGIKKYKRENYWIEMFIVKWKIIFFFNLKNF